jgi:hypothetical protein
MKIGILGLCPVCEGEFKVRAGKLVHHGFERPGDGMIHGDCFAVGYEPYERSSKGSKNFKKELTSFLAKAKEARTALDSKTYFAELRVTREGYGRNAKETITTVEYALGVTKPYAWARLVDGKIRDIEFRIRALEGDIARMDRLIAAWSLKPLREVTEAAASAATKALRDARTAERDAKNAVKDAKAAALKAKRDARKAKGEVAFEALVAKLTGIKSGPMSSEEKTRHALAAWGEFFSPKTKREVGPLMDFYYAFRKGGHDGLLLDLGIAHRERDWVSYPSWTYTG